MNYVSVFITLLLQFASQTFLIRFSDSDYLIRKDGQKVHVQTSPTINAIRVPQFYDIPVVIKRFYLKEQPVKMKVLNYTYSQVVKNVDIQMTPSPVPFSVKKTAYKYTGEGIHIEYPAYLADVRKENGIYIANVIIFPFKYDKKERILLKLDSCNIEFELHSGTVTSRKAYDEPLYLIVSTDSIIHGFDSLALWKKQKGYRVKLLSMEEIDTTYTGLDSAEKLRNALKEYYADSGLMYVLLGGDVDKVPARIAYAMTCNAGYRDDEDSIRADLYYSDLDGTWDFDGDGIYGEVEDSVELYPDVYVGRVPVDNIEEARNFSRKLINYEQHPTQRADNALFFAMILWNDDPYPYTNSGESKDYIDTTFMPEYYEITKLYEALGNETYESVTSALKEGQGILNHDGHGWWTGMWLNGSPSWEHLSNEDADTLKMAFSGVLYSIGCWVGAFDREDAISEHFVLNPDGPVAMIANSRYGWGSPGNPLYGYSDKFDHNFYRKIFIDSVFHVGMTLAEDKADYIPLSHWKNVYRWHQYQLNLFGDPEMEIHTRYEGDVLSNFPLYLHPGGTVSFSVYDTTGRVLSGARVSLSYGDSVYVVAQTGFSGAASITVPENIPDSMLLLIYARNHRTLIRWVYNSGTVLAENFEILNNDSASYFYPDETGTLKINFRNLTGSSISDFYVKLTGNNITFAQDSVVIEDTVLPDSTFSITVGFSIPSNLADSDKISFTVENSWGSRTFIRYIKKPHVLLRPRSPVNLVTEGVDTFELVIYNAFSYDLFNVVVYIQSASGITPYQDSIMTGTIHAHDSVVIGFSGYVSDSIVNIEYRIKNNAFLDDTVSISYGLNPGKYLFDFETSMDGFYFTGNWQRTTTRSHSGNYSVWSGISGHYANNAHDTLMTPWIKTGYSPVLSFYMWYDAATYGTDGVHIYYNVNNAWRELDYLGSGGALMDKSFIVGWSEYRYLLEGLGYGDSTRIMFVLITDDSDTAEGFYIDDISVNSVSYSSKEENPHYGFYVAMPSIINTRSLSFEYKLKKAPSIFVFDVNGRKLLSRKLKSKKGRANIDLGEIMPGLYFVIVSQNNEKIVKKVVVER